MSGEGTHLDSHIPQNYQVPQEVHVDTIRPSIWKQKPMSNSLM